MLSLARFIRIFVVGKLGEIVALHEVAASGECG